jgi:hypothetical protein
MLLFVEAESFLYFSPLVRCRAADKTMKTKTMMAGNKVTNGVYRIVKIWQSRNVEIFFGNKAVGFCHLSVNTGEVSCQILY